MAAQVWGVSPVTFLYGRVGQTGQDVGQIFSHRDGEPAAAFDNGENGGHARAGWAVFAF